MSSRFLVAAAPAVFVLMWATGFVVARLSAPHAEPFTFLTLRFAVAAVLFAVIATVLRAPWPKGAARLHALVAGALLHALYLGPVYWAVAHGLPAGVAALIVGLQPLLTALLAAGLLTEAVGPRHWLGLAVGMAGVGLVLAPKLELSALGGITPLTAGAALLGAFSIALGTVYQKRFASGFHLASAAVWQYVGAGLVTGLAVLGFERFHFDGSVNAWLALAWSVLVLSLTAITLLMWLIREGAVARVASLIFLVPGVSAVMAYGLFGEILVPLQVIGMAVTAAAVLIVNRGPAAPA